MPSHDIPLNLRYMWRSNRSSTETLNVQSNLLDSQDPSIGPILLSFCLSFVSFRRADFILTVGVLSVFGSTRVWDPGNRENVSTLDSSGIAGSIISRNIR